MEDRDRYLDEMRSYLERHPDGSPPPKEKILVDAVRKVWEENGKDVSSLSNMDLAHAWHCCYGGLKKTKSEISYSQ